MRLIIEIPDDQVAEFARMIAFRLSPGVLESLVPESRGSRPAGDGEGPLSRGAKDSRTPGLKDSPNPTDGRTLLGWADRHGLRAAVLKLGRSRRYPSKVLTWTAEQVADVVHELGAKPPKGSQSWGGAAGSGQLAPK